MQRRNCKLRCRRSLNVFASLVLVSSAGSRFLNYRRWNFANESYVPSWGPLNERGILTNTFVIVRLTHVLLLLQCLNFVEFSFSTRSPSKCSYEAIYGCVYVRVYVYICTSYIIIELFVLQLIPWNLVNVVITIFLCSCYSLHHIIKLMCSNKVKELFVVFEILKPYFSILNILPSIPECLSQKSLLSLILLILLLFNVFRK